MSKISGLFASVAAAALSLALLGGPAYAGDIVGLITKTNTNPFFVKMKQGFEAKAKELGLTPQSYAGKSDGDNDGAGRRDRAADRRRRQGHPAGAERLDRDRADGRRRRATPAFLSSRSTRRSTPITPRTPISPPTTSRPAN